MERKDLYVRHTLTGRRPILIFCPNPILGAFLLIILAIFLTDCHSGRKIGGATLPEGNGPASGPSFAATAALSKEASDSFLPNLLARYPGRFGRILAHPDSFRVQIIYTRIDRGADNVPSFRNYYYHADPGMYFYPASTVKLPVAIMALQKLNALRLPGLDMNSTLVTERASGPQTAVFNDPNTADGRPTVAQYIKRILLVSDNDAFNRLYEFLGQQFINEQLHKMGYRDAAILHRLDIFLPEAENRRTNPVSFYDTAGNVLYHQPVQVSELPYPVRSDSVGSAFFRHDSLIVQPMDFSKKNRIALADLHQILRSVIFPGSVPDEQNFHLRPEDYRFLLQYLSEFPGESAYPSYDPAEFPDSYGKFLFYGGEGNKTPLPRNGIRIFSKEGDAYGFLTDISYFTDPASGVEFMLSATIYCNHSGIANADQYDYDSIGLPFMKDLGRVIYDYEKQRPKEHLPDLSSVKLMYY